MGRAIAKQVKDFYSQYEGQSWKNVISIGDSSFERLGTLQATKEYLKNEGVDAVTLEANEISRIERKVFVTDAPQESPRSPLLSSVASSNSPSETASTLSPSNRGLSELTPTLRGSEINLDGHIYHVR